MRNNICSENSGGWTSLFWCLGCLRDGVQQSRIMINVLNLGQFWATAWSQLKKWWWWSLCWDCNPNAPRSLTPLFKQGGRLVAWLRTWKWQPLLEDFAVVQCDVIRMSVYFHISIKLIINRTKLSIQKQSGHWHPNYDKTCKLMNLASCINFI